VGGGPRALRERHEAKWREVLSAYFRRQEATLRSRAPNYALNELFFDEARWNEELHQDLFRMNAATATVWARFVARQIDLELDESLMLGYLDENARIGAENINRVTREEIAAKAMENDLVEAVGLVFAVAITARVAEIATSKVTTAASFGSQEAARQGGLKTKTWQVNSANPRDDHAMMDGETVAIWELFSNGMRWPGDPAGGAEQNSNCQCSVTFGR